MSNLTDLANKPLQKQPIPPGVQDAMAQVATDTEGLPGQYQHGLGTETGFLRPESGIRAGGALGGDDQTANVFNALGLRSERHADDYVNNLKRGIELNAPVIRSAGYGQQAGNVNALGQIELNNYRVMKQQQMNQIRVGVFEQQQQQSLIAGILGILGTIGGAVIGAAVGGPVGALAGATAGKAAGGR